MKLTTSLLALAMSSFVAADCGWSLTPDDCICMNSVNGGLLQSQTTQCCSAMGLKTKDKVSAAQPRSSGLLALR